MIIRIWGNILYVGKKSTSSFTFSLSYFFIAKMFWTCFGYFGHARLCTPKLILSIYRKLSCSAGKKSTWSCMLFWRLTVSILAHNSRTRIFHKYGIDGEISTTLLAFILDYFEENLMTKFFKNSSKNYLGGNLGLFCSNLVKSAFCGKESSACF